jgi:hypothetical protein
MRRMALGPNGAIRFAIAPYAGIQSSFELSVIVI